MVQAGIHNDIGGYACDWQCVFMLAGHPGPCYSHDGSSTCILECIIIMENDDRVCSHNGIPSLLQSWYNNTCILANHVSQSGTKILYSETLLSDYIWCLLIEYKTVINAHNPCTVFELVKGARSRRNTMDLRIIRLKAKDNGLGEYWMRSRYTRERSDEETIMHVHGCVWMDA
jgi:hypothetical protein